MSLLMLFGGGVFQIATPASAADWDPIAAIDTMAPGVVLQRSILDGVVVAFAAGGYRPLTAAQIIAVTGPLPPPLTSIPRLCEVV